MSYVALYRKFRPRTFDEVKGQDHIVTTLKNQVKTGRLQHAYLFTGTRGTGKTSVAKILARAVNCEHPVDGSPCGECETCRNIASGTSMNVIEIDAASNNGVENIREIIDEVQYRPTEGKYKVYIIDEVHMLSTGAFNALLKTLEEPPSYVIFILATTEVGKVPITILSRCQRYDFHRIDTATITARMRELMDKEGVQAEDKALRFIARAADGSMRDALSLLDRCIAFYMNQDLTYEKALKALGEADTTIFSTEVRYIQDGNAGAAVRIFEKQVQRGVEIGQFVTDFIRYLRNLLLVATSSPADAEEMVDVSAEQMADLTEMTNEVTPDQIMRYIRVLSELQSSMRYATNRRVLAEVALIRMAKPQTETGDDSVLDRLRQLETKVADILSGSYVPANADGQAGNDRSTPVPDLPEKSEDDGEPLPDAAPEDLKEICANWNRLVRGLKEGLFREQLEDHAAVQYNADTLENKLYIELEPSPAANVVLRDKDRIDAFGAYLDRTCGRHVEFELHRKDSRSGNLKTIDLDSCLEKIGMPVIEEED